MCNLHSTTIHQAAILALFRVVNRYVGNLQPMPGVFPGLASACDPQHRRGDRDDANAMEHAIAPRTALDFDLAM
jgi:hypothetical protein